ncbi:hypothetical protein [Streptomyces flaveolus]|uniref:hypothetical protein n=1 Tax=Streptomyces flaveolus TaxID=67297 RepID=UPI003324DB57
MTATTHPTMAAGLDQRAVENDVGHAFASTAVQDLVQVGGLVGENVDALVQVAAACGMPES